MVSRDTPECYVTRTLPVLLSHILAGHIADYNKRVHRNDIEVRKFALREIRIRFHYNVGCQTVMFYFIKGVREPRCNRLASVPTLMTLYAAPDASHIILQMLM